MAPLACQTLFRSATLLQYGPVRRVSWLKTRSLASAAHCTITMLPRMLWCKLLTAQKTGPEAVLLAQLYRTVHNTEEAQGGACGNAIVSHTLRPLTPLSSWVSGCAQWQSLLSDCLRKPLCNTRRQCAAICCFRMQFSAVRALLAVWVSGHHKLASGPNEV